MNRKNFFKRLGILLGVAVIAPKSLLSEEKKPKGIIEVDKKKFTQFAEEFAERAKNIAPYEASQPLILKIKNTTNRAFNNIVLFHPRENSLGANSGLPDGVEIDILGDYEEGNSSIEKYCLLLLRIAAQPIKIHGLSAKQSNGGYIEEFKYVYDPKIFKGQIGVERTLCRIRDAYGSPDYNNREHFVLDNWAQLIVTELKANTDITLKLYPAPKPKQGKLYGLKPQKIV